MKTILAVLALAWATAYASAASKPPAALRLEISASHDLFEAFSNDEEIRLFVRSSAPGYLTVYHIRPDSGFAILYPQPQHHWRELEAKKEYRLTDLAAELQLKYREVRGYVYLGFIITPEPIHLVPWLEQAFSERGIKSGVPPELAKDETLEAVVEKVETDVRFRMGETQPSSFALLPLFIQSHFQFFAEERDEAPKPQRYYAEGRYYYLKPDVNIPFRRPFRRPPFYAPSHSPTTGANGIAPTAPKTRTQRAKPPRREE